MNIEHGEAFVARETSRNGMISVWFECCDCAFFKGCDEPAAWLTDPAKRLFFCFRGHLGLSFWAWNPPVKPLASLNSSEEDATCLMIKWWW